MVQPWQWQQNSKKPSRLLLRCNINRTGVSCIICRLAGTWMKVQQKQLHKDATTAQTWTKEQICLFRLRVCKGHKVLVSVFKDNIYSEVTSSRQVLPPPVIHPVVSSGHADNVSARVFCCNFRNISNFYVFRFCFCDLLIPLF